MKWFLTILFTSLAFTLQAQDYKLEGNEVQISKPVLFENGTAKLKQESTAALEIIVKYLTDKSYISQLRVESHTYGLNDSADQILSEKRALTVCKKLIELGVDCKRLIAVGFGHTKPIFNPRTVGAGAENVHIDFYNVALRGHVIGGLPIDGGGKVAGELCN